MQNFDITIENLKDQKQLSTKIKSMNEKQLNDLCSVIREFLLKSLCKTGGHLASNLGVVELSVALHKIFETPNDKIVWDVGHQSYVHKILTSRASEFSTLRKTNGLCGFPRRSESEHDSFDTGHSSTSISAALGMALARDLKNEKKNIIAVIGDGALTGGMAFEALNFVGRQKTKLIIILNDNEMSISKNVGAMDYHLSKLRGKKTYLNIKRGIIKASPPIARFLEKIKNSIKYAFLDSALFEQLGIKYIGPINGHDIEALQTVLEQAKNFTVPVLIHVITKKGQGYSPAQIYPEKYHGVSPFNLDVGVNNSASKNNSSVFANELVRCAKTDSSIVAITAAMPEGTGLTSFANLFPQRFFDVGIAEQNAMTMAAGLAASGLKPVFAVYSSFLQRAFDQTLHDVCLQKLPVIIAVDRAGFVGEDGATHHGIYDIAFLSLLPNLVIISPSSQEELCACVEFALCLNEPVAIRYSRGLLQSAPFEKNELKAYKWILPKQPIKNITIIATGTMVQVCKKAQEILVSKNVEVSIVNAIFISPIDTNALDQIFENSKLVVCVEEGVVRGGFGEKIAAYCSGNYDSKTLCLGILNEPPIEHGNVLDLLEIAGLTPENISNTILNKLHRTENN